MFGRGFEIVQPCEVCAATFSRYDPMCEVLLMFNCIKKLKKLHTHTCTYTWVYTHKHTHTHTHVQTHAHTHTRTHTHTHTHTRVHTQRHKHTCAHTQCQRIGKDSWHLVEGYSCKHTIKVNTASYFPAEITVHVQCTCVNLANSTNAQYERSRGTKQDTVYAMYLYESGQLYSSTI